MVRSIFYSADLVIRDGSDTTSDGEPCEDGSGYYVESGWYRPEWTMWAVYADRGEKASDTFDAADHTEMPFEAGYAPIGWLAERLSHTLTGLAELETLNGDAESGVTVYSSDAYEHPYEGKSVRVAAHVYGYTLAQVVLACQLANDHAARVAYAREYGVVSFLSAYMRQAH